MFFDKQRHLIVRFLLLVGLLHGMFGLTTIQIVHATTDSTGTDANDGKTQPALLQYATDGHILGFAPNKVYLAGLDHALTVEFSSESKITPVGQAASTFAQSNVPALGRVTYEGVWQGIDVLYTSAQDGVVESTYIVHAGAQPADIRLLYNTPVQLMKDGTLRFAFESGYIAESAPIAFQNIDGKYLPVDVRFTLTEGLVSFIVGDYNPNYTLTIDPLYTWHTFYGATQGLQGGIDEGRAITTDADGNIYVAGSSENSWNGPGNIAPLHAFTGNTDIVVIKLNSAGTYQWHTFYGDPANDNGYAITSDASGIYVAGTSMGTWYGPGGDLPLHPYLGANSEDIVVLKLNSEGAYQWHTFYGGPANTGSSAGRDYGYAITHDSTGIYVSGSSELTWNGAGNVPPLNPHPGFAALVVLKLDTAGAYRWHTFYGSGTGTYGYGMTSDGTGNVYAAGTSGGWNGPGNAAPLNAFSGGSAPDMVIVKLNGAGAYQWHTFYGSASGWDIAYALTSDVNGNVIAAGYSNSVWNGPNEMAPLNTYTGPGNFKLTVLKLDSAGTYQWHTFYNHSNNNYAITSDERGDLYVASSSGGWNGPGNTAPLNAFAGGFDTMVLKLNGAGDYQWHTFYGSVRNDYGYAIAGDGQGNMVVAGTGTGTWNGPGNIPPLSPYGHAPNAPGSDILIMKLDVELLTVTLEQSASQPDPTSDSPVVFDILFSAPVTGFDETDIDLSASTARGTLSAVVTEVAPNDGTTYTMSVSGMTGNGAVIASIPAGAAQDATGNSSEASTSVDNSVDYKVLKLVVTKPDDTDDSICDSDCSLREAIADIASGGTITFDPSLAGQTIVLSSTLVVNKDLTIDGSSLASKISISGNNAVRIFKLGSHTVTIQSVILENGDSTGSASADYYGGAIYTTNNFTSSTNLTVKDVTFLNNVAYQGGAIYATGGVATILESEFINNASDAMGGAIYVERGDLTVKNSMFNNNAATWSGGAISFASGLKHFIENNTFSNNTAIIGGGAIFFDQRNNHEITIRNNLFSENASTGDYNGGGAIRISAIGGQGIQGLLENNTFYANWSAVANGGAIVTEGNWLLRNNTFSNNRVNSGNSGASLYMSAANTVLQNNIFANSAGGQECSALSGATTGNNNLVEDGSGPCSSLPGTIIADPLLGALADNGGPTQTMALLPGSPAINAGENATCSATDQRGVARPVGSQCDLGAFEYIPLYISLTGSQTISGVSSSDEDILRFDGLSWSLYFDGSDVRVASPDLSAFSLMDADTILMAFSANVTVNGITATPQDILRFDATSLGSTTAGTFSLYFDGSDVGLDTSSENIDGLDLLPDGRVLISTTGNPSITGMTGARDEDIFVFTPTTLGNDTSGSWARYLDGSSVGLGESSDEDIDALDVGLNGDLYLSSFGNFAVAGLSGADEDVFICMFPTESACSYPSALDFDGSAWGLAANDIDGVDFFASGWAPTVIPTNTPTRTPTATPTATSTPTPTATSTAGTGTTVTFLPVADARVSQASPNTNYGTATALQVDGDSGAAQTSFLTFNASGMTGPILSAKLRVFCTTNGTVNGPTVHGAFNSWHEYGVGGVTWNTQPALESGPVDNKGSIAANSWVEYDVTALMTTNATYSFALVAESSDGIVFSSREGTTPPQLVVTFASGPSTSTPTATNPPALTNTPTATPSATLIAVTATPTATATQTAGTSSFTFTSAADGYVDANNPATTYGSATTLRVDGSPVIRSYLRFNVQGLNGPVTRATLRVFANSSSSQGYTVSGVSNNTWTESTLNYNNAPPLGSALGSSGLFGAGIWVNVDVTAYITGNGTYSLALTTPGTTAVSLASRESGANAPQLVIETSP